MTVGVWDITQWEQSVWSQESVPYTPLLESYTDLVAIVVQTIKDNDVDADQARIFIRQSQEKLQRDLMNKGLDGDVPRQMMARGTTNSTENSAVTLPADHFRTRSVLVNGQPARSTTPEKVPPNQAGYVEADITLDYYQRLATISNENPTTWLFQVAPDAYIYGACLQYVPWGHEPEVFELWKTFYEDAIRGVRQTEGPQPRGAITLTKGRPYGAHYATIGNTMIFGR